MRKHMIGVDLVVEKPDDFVFQHGQTVNGTGKFIDATNFEFTVGGRTPHGPNNRIVYKGARLTCRMRKDKRYGVSFYVTPDCNLAETLKQVHGELKRVFGAIEDDIKQAGGES